MDKIKPMSYPENVEVEELKSSLECEGGACPVK
jgi:hypothetical protein